MRFFSRLFGNNVTVPVIDYLKSPIVVLNRQGLIISCNTIFSSITSLKQDKLIDRDCRDIEPLDSLWNSITACILHRTSQTERITFNDKIFSVLITPVVEEDFLKHVVIEFEDISNYVNLEKDYLKRNKELIVTNALSDTFITSNNLDSVFSDLLNKVLVISGMSIGWITVLKNNIYKIMSIKGVSGEFRKNLEKGELDVLYNKHLRSNEQMFVYDHQDVSKVDMLKKESIVFFTSIPLKINQDTKGFLSLACKMDINFDFDTASLFSMLGKYMSLITEKVSLYQEIQHLAVTDTLTELYNMRHFYKALDSEIARADRYGQVFSLVLFDVDDFKVINDKYGHQAGDEILKDLARILKEISRRSDVVARYGGEEFIVLLPNTDRDEAYRQALRVKEAVEEFTFLNNSEIKLTISGGLSTCPTDEKTAKELLYAADMALYKAKASGKKMICRFKD